MNSARIIQSIWLLSAIGLTLALMNGFHVTVDFGPVVDWVRGL